MKRPVLVVVGVVAVLAGALFTLQGVGAMSGTTMSNSSFWAVAGPVIVLIGLTFTGVGARGRSH